MQEYRKILAYRPEPLSHHGLRRLADHYPVPFLDRKFKQFIAHRTANKVYFHSVTQAV